MEPQETSRMPRLTVGRLASAVTLLLVMIAVFSVTIVETGQVGVVTRSGSDQVRILAEPGIYPRLPFVERVWLVDTRIQIKEQGTPQAYLTADNQTLQLSGWVAWRVSDPQRFGVSMSSGKNPADDQLLKAISDVLADWASSRPAAALLQGQDEAAWVVALNARLSQFGLQVVGAGLRQAALSATASEAVYERMSAARTQSSRQLIAGLMRDQRQWADLQTRQQTQVLNDAYRAAQQTRQAAENELLAAYARQYGAATDFANALRNPAVASEQTGQEPVKP